MFDAVLKKKKRSCSGMMLGGLACCVLGILFSAAMMSTGDYEHFYWYGIVLTGFGLFLTGLVQRIRFGEK